MAIIISSSMSDSGKSLLTAVLVKHLRGIPFKAQNMSLNSFPTKDGGEIAFIQAFQAIGGGLAPQRFMNPVLLKPSGKGIEVIVWGESQGNLSAEEYYSKIGIIWEKINSVISKEMVIESAGGIGEPNFIERDISGFKIMQRGVPSVLVLDIERGGAFASAYGIYNMLPSSVRDKLKGFIINKFRGDEKLLDQAISWLENRTSMKYLGVIPYDERLRIMAEDSMNVSDLGDGELEVGVISYPYMSNFNEFHVFANSNARLRFITKPSQLSKADLVILPGTRNTKISLTWLIERGFLDVLKRKTVLGICGGFQIMGNKLLDPFGLEAGEPSSYEGLGLLPINVKFRSEKVVSISRARSDFGSIDGYEIRRGDIDYIRHKPLLQIEYRNGAKVEIEDGAWNENFIGLSIHGSLYSEGGKAILKQLGIKIGSSSLEDDIKKSVNLAYDIIKDKVDLERIEQIYIENDRNET
ncbi:MULTISPECIES: cobyric acid synthase [Metallosphaera]|uniref:Probable cobyric acid synthase n=1 Tax=Metallosphaera cuprina (strain Ar-4) TaxID=1006006 RepID=F4G189_METCR|nr:cobyric acid synthase [Metallosphaera cuprina]AEB95976.1 adenosylcobyric acid synthase (glutamine-hydrolysing) [Metallosphaera cuprina Ar-4]